jgi:MFS family permease
LVFLFLGSEKESGHGSTSSLPREPGMGVFQSIRWVLRSLSFWQIGTLAFFSYGTIISLQGLWLGPFLTETQGYSSIEAGKMLTLIPIGAIVGGPIGGRLSDRTPHSQKSVLLGGLGLYCLGLFALSGILLKTQNPYWYGFLFFWLGFFNGYLIVMYSHLRELFPVSISGTVMTLANFFTMAGGAIFMPSLGGIIKSFPRINQAYPADVYYLSFLICFLGMVLSLIFYAFSKKGNQI